MLNDPGKGLLEEMIKNNPEIEDVLSKLKLGNNYLEIFRELEKDSKYSQQALKNKRKMTYEMKLPTSKGQDIYGHGGKCDSNVINNCNMAKTTAKFSNKK